MSKVRIFPAKRLRGEITPPPDKSISHRAVMFSSLAKGTSVVRNFLRAGDTLSTMNAFRALGVDIKDEGHTLTITGRGREGLREADNVIDCGNSGTTMRLMSGLLSGTALFSVLTGDESLRQRPMGRVITPLSLMGAEIRGRGNNRFAPLAISGKPLRPIEYDMPIASAQVKSSVLLAGLGIRGSTVVRETEKSRDHTERMLPAFGADLTVNGLEVRIRGGRELHPSDTEVPGDFSSAAFFLVAALVVPDSEILLRNVGMNPTRTGLLRVLERMGARIGRMNERTVSGEPAADLVCRSADGLTGTAVTAEDVPSLIDEFPILCVAAACAEGTTTVHGAKELRVKELDRIAAMASELGRMGVVLEEHEDGITIQGNRRLKAAPVESHGDHRIAMSMAIAGLAAEGETAISGADAASISFPTFFDMLRGLAS